MARCCFFLFESYQTLNYFRLLQDQNRRNPGLVGELRSHLLAGEQQRHFERLLLVQLIIESLRQHRRPGGSDRPAVAQRRRNSRRDERVHHPQVVAVQQLRVVAARRALATGQEYEAHMRVFEQLAQPQCIQHRHIAILVAQHQAATVWVEL